MVMNQECIKVSYILNIVRVLYISATLVPILGGGDYKEYITEVCEPMHRC